MSKMMLFVQLCFLKSRCKRNRCLRHNRILLTVMPLRRSPPARYPSSCPGDERQEEYIKIKKQPPFRNDCPASLNETSPELSSSIMASATSKGSQPSTDRHHLQAIDNNKLDKYLLEIAIRPRSQRPLDGENSKLNHDEAQSTNSTKAALHAALWESLSEDMQRCSRL